MIIKGFQQITLDATTAQALTVPAGTHKAIVSAESNHVRLRMDGSDPTSGVGELLLTTGPTRELHGTELTAAKFISSTGSAKINVHYYGSV